MVGCYQHPRRGWALLYFTTRARQAITRNDIVFLKFPVIVMPRPKLNKTTLHTRVDPETLRTLKRVALSLGLTRTASTGERVASIGLLIDIIVKDLAIISRLNQINELPVDNLTDDS